MSERRPISTVVVGGADIVAWSAAAALKRRIESLEVLVVAAAGTARSIADRIISSTPSIHGFHREIGLTDADTIVRAQSGLRVGTLFEGWADDLPPYVHAYGPYGTPVGGVSFHQLWERERQRRTDSIPPFDHFSPAAQLARTGAPRTSGNEQIQYGLQLTLDRYRALMRDYALHLGVRTHPGAIRDVIVRSSDGFIDKVVCTDGSKIGADLFVDCTGSAALLRSRIDQQSIGWQQWLLNDRFVEADGAAEPTLTTMDRATTIPFGWRWAASSPEKSSRGLVYSSAHATDDEIEREFGADARLFKLNQGRWREFWVRNCVAVGDAAVAIEPLEWTNLHLAHSQIDRLISMMPDRDCAPIELAEFNRQCAAEADRVRDFVCLHYICSRRSEPFWKESAAVTPPDSLAHALALFAERGRLPYYEEETFARDSWLAVLFGQGLLPRRIDPLADAVTPGEADRAFAAMRQSLGSFTLPATTAASGELNPHGIR